MAECQVCGKVFDPLSFQHECQRLSRPSTVRISVPLPQPGERLVVASASQPGDEVQVSGYVQEVAAAESQPPIYPRWPKPAATPGSAESGVLVITREMLEAEQRKAGEAMPGVMGQPVPIEPPTPRGDENAQRVWTSWLSGNLCAELHILRADLPRDRQAMRRLLHERLQAFGDALMEEYDRQLWEDT